jgi:transposase
MLWPPNSPDLNAIEPPWMWMKKETTKGGAATSKKKLTNDWCQVCPPRQSERHRSTQYQRDQA